MPNGRICTILRDRGFGFITPNSTTEESFMERPKDLFFHMSALGDLGWDDTLLELEVIYDVGTSPQGKLRAENVKAARP